MKIIERLEDTILVEMSKSEVCICISTNEDSIGPSLNCHTIIPCDTSPA